MSTNSSQAPSVRFGPYEADLTSGELRKNGIRLKLQDQPFQVLAALLERPGELVTREELRQRLWADDTFVDFDNGLNTAIQKLRETLSDSARHPRYVETVPRRGYRWIGESPTPLAGPEIVPHSSRGRFWSIAAALAVLSLAVGVWLFFTLDSPKGPLEAGGFVRPVPLTSYPGVEQRASFSPDGSQVAFSWNGPEQDNEDVYVQVVGSGTPLRLTADPAPDRQPGWSPDGRQIAFVRTNGEGRSVIILISPLGGPERRLAEMRAPQSQFDGALSWSPDGKFLAVSEYVSNGDHQQAIVLLAVDSGEKRQLTTPPSGATDLMPAFSPDGQTIAFDRKLGWMASSIFVVPLPEGEPRRVASLEGNASGLAWSRDGRDILYGGSDTLWRLPVTGGAPHLVRGTGDSASQPAISRVGNRLAFTQREFQADIWRLDLEAPRGTLPYRFISSTRHDSSPAFSPDGSQIAFSSARSGASEIWVCQSDGSHPMQLTSLGFSAGSPSWSPDGSQIAFDAPTGGDTNIFVVRASGGAPRQITHNPSQDVIPSWSPDGRWIYFSSNRTGEAQIWRKRVGGDRSEESGAMQVTRKGGRRPKISADSAFLYYTKEFSSVWRQPLDGGEEERIIGPVTHTFRWALTGEGIYFIALDQTGPSSESWKLRFHSLKSGQAIDVAHLHYTPHDRGPGLSVSPDGRWVLGVRVEFTSDLMLVEGFQ